jgi:hypothetical protein
MTRSEIVSHMLKHRRTSERLHRVNIAGGLLPSVSLIEDLIKFLNGTRTEGGKIIVRVLEQMLEIDAMAKPIKGIVLPAMELKRTHPAKFKLLCKIDDKVAQLQRELARFKFVPRAEVVQGGSGNASEWGTWWGRGDDKEESDPGLRMRGFEAVETILRITQIGSLTRLRRCAHCGKWLYAKFRHQNYCSTECQQKNYTQSDQWKAHRREYMRNYYQRTWTKPKKAKRGD